MKNPPPLHESSDPLVRRLLRAGRVEQPEPQAMRRTLGALAAQSVLTTSAAAAASAALPWGALAKAIAIGATTGAIATGTHTLVSHDRAKADVPTRFATTGASSSAPSRKVARPNAAFEPFSTPADSEESDHAQPADSEESDHAEPADMRPQILRGPASGQRKAQSRQNSAQRADVAATPVDRAVPSIAISVLQREVELIDHARARLAAGDLPNLFAALREYEREFSNGTLAKEAQYLRMRAHSLVKARGE